MKTNNHAYLEESKSIVVLRNKFLCLCNSELTANVPLSHVKFDDTTNTVQLSRVDSLKLKANDYAVITNFIDQHRRTECM
ncbi:hypothetical protein EK599_04965 [Vibrio sp. T187]|uniref:hypothetical protein n=1 Tax=Vibrio TaxID=662 RepID=UPI0010C98910|nr:MULTISPECIES: hypothetical protein [Vibrio]MBW3695030.1 hypothetical protein [Vibrio sp. T187]